MEDLHIRIVRRTTRERVLAQEKWELAIREAVRPAVGKGHSLREVAEAAGISHTRVRQIVNGE